MSRKLKDNIKLPIAIFNQDISWLHFGSGGIELEVFVKKGMIMKPDKESERYIGKINIGNTETVLTISFDILLPNFYFVPKPTLQYLAIGTPTTDARSHIEGKVDLIHPRQLLTEKTA